MADIDQISATYDPLDILFINAIKHKFGEGAPVDITGARFSGDFRIPYVGAQTRKQDYILQETGFKEGDFFLDIGSGWGPMLERIKKEGGKATGLTLSRAQERYCREKGLDARLVDWNDFSLEKMNGGNPYDAVISVGSFEHFCSIEDYEKGEQGRVYNKFFETVSEALKPEGRLFLQTMTFGPRYSDQGGFPDVHQDADPKAPKGSLERSLGHMRALFPGSFLPSGQRQIIEAASPYFELVGSEDGVKDYIETTRVWDEAIHSYLRSRGLVGSTFDLAKFLWRGRKVPENIDRLKAILESSLGDVFVNGQFGHKRLTFLKKK